MTTIRVDASKSYDVIIGGGLLGSSGKLIKDAVKPTSAMIVSDDIVYPLYGEKVRACLEAEGIKVFDYVFPNGEGSKNLAVYGGLMEKLCESRLNRSDVIVALGGGVVGDLAGFAAATYQRGIAFVQLPTTLLAAVDSSVGGKTAVNLAAGKNQAGCFWQPSLVICDTDTIGSLPAEQFSNGCGEIIKHAMLFDADFFEYINSSSIKDNLEYVIGRNIEMKRDIITKDEYDRGARMLLNFGHTLGHAAEHCSGYTLLHGMGVAMGMAAITRSAAAFGLCSSDTLSRLLDILRKYSLPTEMPYSAEELCEAVTADKKLFGDRLNLIVPRAVGDCFIKTVPITSVLDWIKRGGIE